MKPTPQRASGPNGVPGPRKDSDADLLPHDPPPFVVRAAAGLVIALFGVVFVAALVVRFPETVHCTFVVTPENGTDPVQSPLPTPSIVVRVAVVEGQTVEAGAELFTLRSDEIRAARLRLETALEELRGLRRRAERLDELLVGQLKLKDEEHAQMDREVAFRARHLSASRDLLERNRRLASDRLISEVEMQRVELAVVESEKDELVARRGLQQIVIQRRQIETERLRQRTEEESTERQLEARIASSRQELADGEDDRRVVRAPHRGVVVRLARHAPGDVVAGSGELCQLARVDDALKARLILPDQGMSRVSPGQHARLFFDAFPHQRFGVLDGRLEWVSPIAVADANAPRFVARASLGATTFPSPEGPRPVLPGMSGTARVRVGRRTVIELVFEPLRQLREEFKP